MLKHSHTKKVNKASDKIVLFERQAGDVGDSDGHLQDGGVGHEDARGRVDAGEEDGQDLSTDGQKL